MFDVKNAERIARHYLVPTVVILLVFSGGFITASSFLWQHYEALLKRQEQLNTDNLKLKTGELELQKRDFIVQQRERLLREREANLAAQAGQLMHKDQENAAVIARLQKEESVLSAEATKKEAEDHIQELMTEFSNLGIDLHESKPYCEGDEVVRRYNSALAKYNEIAAIAKANHLDYDQFLSNSQPGSMMSFEACVDKENNNR